MESMPRIINFANVHTTKEESQRRPSKNTQISQKLCIAKKEKKL